MAGLVLDNPMPKVISARTHAVIDYIHAGTNFVAAAFFWKSNRRAAAGAFGLGAAVLINALMTDYHLGVFRAWSFKVHGLLDYGVAAKSAAMPAMLGFHDTAEANYFYAQGVAEAMTAGITDYDDESGAQRHRGYDYGAPRAA